MRFRDEWEERSLEKDGGTYAIAVALLEVVHSLGRIEDQMDAFRQVWLNKDGTGVIAESIVRAGELISDSINDLPDVNQIEDLIKAFKDNDAFRRVWKESKES